MRTRRFIIYFLFIIALIVYLFVSAPPPIHNKTAETSTISIVDVFEILEQENKTIRSIYTNDIVKPGLKRNINFSENWKDDDVVAGPLPAQFLRLIARQLEAEKLPLGLFLGSDYPINTSNRYSDIQLVYFDYLKKTGIPQFFYIKEIERHIYMSADIAISNACINCHNQHKDSPKTNWQLHDIMGATTWTYPKDRISYEELMQLIQTFRQSVKHAYSQVLNKFQSRDPSIRIGDKWPTDGHYLPELEVLMQRYQQQASHNTLQGLLGIQDKKDSQGKSI